MHPFLSPELQTQYRQAGWWEDRTLAEIVEQQAAARPAKHAIVGERLLTYAELDECGRTLAGALRAAGAGPGDLLVIVHDIGWEGAVVQIAASRLGMVVAPLSATTTARRGANVVRKLAANFVVVSPSVAARPEWAMLLRDRAAEMPTVACVVATGVRGEVPGLPALDELLEGRDRFDDRLPQPGPLAIILSSGGTTGAPKAVMQHENAIVYSSRRTIARAALTEDDVYLGLGPYGYITTTGHMYYVSFLLGASLLMLRRWNAVEAAGAIRKWGVTFSQIPPAAMLDLLELGGEVEKQLATFRVAVTGAKPNHFFGQFTVRFGTAILRAYGMTEAPLHTLVDFRRPEQVRGDVEGFPFEGTELLLVDATGEPVPDGQPGEALVRSPALFLGYFNQPDKTADVVTEDGFYRTGDLLVRGSLGFKVVDRLKDIVRRGGMNIDPNEVETALAAHPSVAEVAVVGAPDRRLGERAVAVVVLAPGTSLSLEDTIDFLRAQGLPAPSLPEALAVLNVLPRTEVGKYDKSALRAMVVSSFDGADRAGNAR